MYVYKLKRTEPPFNLKDIIILTDLYKPEFVKDYSSLMGVNINVKTHFNDVGDLIEWLREVEEKFLSKTIFSKRPKTSLTNKSLDDFLTNRQGHVYSLNNVMVFIKRKIDVLKPLLDHKENTSIDYYYRNSIYALEDCFQLFYSVGIIIKNS